MKPEPVTEAYLRRATRGLWGKKRLEVREELAAHLHERVMAFRIGGLGETDAVNKALAELGKPQEVSLGMAKLYTFPKVMGSGIIGAAICVFTLAAWPHTIAQGVKSIFYLPTKECVSALEPNSKVPISQVCNVMSSGPWLERKELSQALRSQGVEVTGVQTLNFSFSGGKSVSVQAGDPGNPEYDIKPADPAYVSLWQLMWALSEQSKLKVSVTGWDNPQVHFGDVTVQVGSDIRSVPGSTFYQNYLSGYVTSGVAEAVFKQTGPKALTLMPRADVGINEYNVKEQALEVIAKSGEVYGVVAILDPKLPAKLSWGRSSSDKAFFADLSTLFSIDTARVEQGGTLTLYLPEQPLKFVKSLGANPEQGTAVLVKLSGSKNQLGYEVVPPERVRYEALKYKTQN